MSEHMRNNHHSAKQSRRGGKRLSAQQPDQSRRREPLEQQPAPAAAEPLIPEWEEAPAACEAQDRRPRRGLRGAVRSWQDSEGEVSPVVTGCKSLAEKAKETRRHWRRLVREKKAKRFPESERLAVQLILLAWGMLPTLGSLLGDRCFLIR